MGVISWFINQLISGGPYPVPDDLICNSLCQNDPKWAQSSGSRPSSAADPTPHGWSDCLITSRISWKYPFSRWHLQHIPYVLYVPIWRFPKIEVPLSILHFCLGFSLINSPFSGGPQPFQPLYILYLAGWPLGKNSIGKVHPKLCPSGSRAEHRWEHLGTDGELVVKWPQGPRGDNGMAKFRQGRWEIQKISPDFLVGFYT